MQPFVSFFNHPVYGPFSIAALFLIIALLVLLPYRWAMLPIVLWFCFMPYSQRFVLFNSDLSFTRIVCLAGWVRIFIKGEWVSFRWCTLDFLMILYTVVSIITYYFLMGKPEAITRGLGDAIDTAGFYFLTRNLVKSWDDLDRLVQYLMFSLIAVAAFFSVEAVTGNNLFALLYNEVPEVNLMRHGMVRCQGAFPHPILAGTIAAVMIPLFVVRWWVQDDTGKRDAVIGTLACLFIVFASTSSTPVLAIAAGIGGAIIFPFRLYIKHFVTIAIIVLIALHLSMEAPVWHLLSRMAVFEGSTAWFRFFLVDQAIQRFDSWWLIGVQSTADWGRGLSDVTNQYIREGVSGGFFKLLLFLSLLGGGFAAVGKMIRVPGTSNLQLKRSWALWIVLLMHAASFTAVSYFGQATQLLYMTIAIVASLQPKLLNRGQTILKPVLMSEKGSV